MNKTCMQEMKKGLIVSCQALESEPLFGSEFMEKMAFAAQLGGAVGIRANGINDINAIANSVHLPIIGLYKKVYAQSLVYITPTLKEVRALLATPVQIIAFDATNHEHPSEGVEEIVATIHQGGRLALADVSSLEEAKRAEALGADAVSSTLVGYDHMPTKQILDMLHPKDIAPDFHLIEQIARSLSIPLFAEGHIHTPEQARSCLDAGAYAVVVGEAITRPQLLTARFVKALEAVI